MGSFQVGQNLYSYEKGSIETYTIVKVGRKYLTVVKTSALPYGNETKLHIDTLKEVKDWGNSHYFYRSEREINDILEKRELITKISRMCSLYTSDVYSIKNLSLDALRRINAIIEEEKKIGYTSWRNI